MKKQKLENSKIKFEESKLIWEEELKKKY